MQIGGLIKLSLVDYPGKAAAVVFTQGCNFRCPYCHNKELVVPSCFQPPLSEEEIIRFFVKRQGLLGGVVITGGEPTLQKDLLNFMAKVKRMGYCVKLDTNGSRPDVLREVITAQLADFIAMDVKAALEHYDQLAGVPVHTRLIKESIALIKNSRIDHQFRTTCVRPLFKIEDMPQIAALVSGAQSYVLQNFAGRESLIDPALIQGGSFPENEFARLREQWDIKV